MAAPVLTLNQQKASLSGKKNKKKVIKNVLGLPTSVKIECQPVDVKEADGLNKILERLLSDARLPAEQSTKLKKQELSPDELKRREQACKIRNQLALGVNALNRWVKKQSISAALIESEIQPKFLIHHLNLLCHHNKIPFIHLPGLRTITRNSLGFPCIALGFKKDFTHFLEAISQIKSISKTQTVSLGENEENSVTVDSSDDDDDSEILESVVETKPKDDETPFTYLYRTSINERVFIPEQHQSEAKVSSNSGFISFGTDDEGDTKSEEQSINSGISNNLVRKQKKKRKLLALKDFNESESDEEDLYKKPKKKPKKDWFIDTVGTKRKFKYSQANILKVQSNPARINRKNKRKNK